MHSRRVMYFASYIGMMLFGISLITLGAVLPDLRAKLGLDEIASGLLFSILPLGIMFGSLIFGPVCDRYGYRSIFSVSSVFIFAGFEGIALSPSVTILKICIFLLGFGGGAINGAANALVSDVSGKNRVADLAILGSFFGIGALGITLLLGLLENRFSFEAIIAVTGFVTLAAGLFFALIRYPLPKQPQGFSIARTVRMIKDNALLTVAFFIFFQSSFEGIFNNWTTSFILDRMTIAQNESLFALSSFVIGMTVMRLLLGTLLRSLSPSRIMSLSFVLLLAGLALLRMAFSLSAAIPALVLTGAGLAAGFPVMLAIVGNRYSEFSGTAFSVVLTIGLIGNMAINYLMGVIAQVFGIHHLTTVAFAELAAMIIIAVFILARAGEK